MLAFPPELPVNARRILTVLPDRATETSHEDRAWALLFIAFSDIAAMPEPKRSEFFAAAQPLWSSRDPLSRFGRRGISG